MFVRAKIIDGKKRRYLVKSYYDKNTKKRHQRNIAYVDLWPEKHVAKFVALHEEYAKSLANAERSDATKVFKQMAASNAAKLFKDIQKFKQAMKINLRPVRRQLDGRGIDPDTGTRQIQYAKSDVPYVLFLRSLSTAKILYQKMLREKPIELWGEDIQSAIKSELNWLNDFRKQLEVK